MGWLKALLCAIALQAACMVQAQPAALNLDPNTQRVDLSQIANVLEDPEGQLDFASASSPALTRQYEPRDSSFGFTTSAWWLRFQVVNPTDAAQVWWFDTGSRTLNELDFYAPDAAGIYQRSSASSDRVFADRPVPTANFVFPFRLEARQTAWVYLRVRSTIFFGITVRPAVWQPSAYLGTEQRETAQWLLYLGMVLALALVNLALWAYLRDRLFGLYVASLFGYATLVSFAQGGFGSVYQYLWPQTPIFHQLVWGIALTLSSQLIWLFSIRLLNLHQFAPKRFAWFWRCYVVAWGMVLFRVSVLFIHVPQLTAWSQRASVVALIMTGLAFLLAATSVVQCYRAKVPFSGYLILSTLPSIVVAPTVTFGTAAGFSGIAPLWLFAAIWEMLVMALALADRFFQERRAKMAAQQDMIDALKQSEHALEVKVAQRTEQLAHSEAKAKDLLHNMLPIEVAAELSSTGTTQPVRHESATVLFTDFVGFTQVASTMPADQMVHELNAIFAAFDDICDECGIEKIKTIGDAYMAAGGVPKACADHAKRCVKAGLRMLAFTQARNQDSAFKWSVRVGIHSGPVVSGVVGKRKFAFDIWGDTVNIASRMESAGEAGKVNVSAYTYHLCRKDFECTYRGKLDAKGKGEVDMYFVVGDVSPTMNST